MFAIFASADIARGATANCGAWAAASTCVAWCDTDASAHVIQLAGSNNSRVRYIDPNIGDAERGYFVTPPYAKTNRLGGSAAASP
jgi:hypothetical protein